MDIPREKLCFTRARGAESSGSGWIVINLRGIDLEGVNELALKMEDIQAVAAGTEASPDTVAKVRSLLGG